MMKKIYRFIPSEKHAGIVAKNKEPTWQLFEHLHQKALGKTWLPLELTLHKTRSSDKIPDVSWYSSSDKVCFLVEKLSELFPGGVPSTIELLPITVDDSPWYLINCLAAANSFDDATLECMRIPLNPPVLVSETWVNVTDTRAYEFEIFHIQKIGSSLVCSESLRDRFMAVNNNGLDFMHVGYIVDNPSQAVPAPPRSVLTPTAVASAIKIKALPLSATQQRILTRAGQRFTTRLQLPADATDEVLLDALTEEVSRLRLVWQELGYDQQEKSLQELSSVYGDLVCKCCGWQWATLKYPRANSYSGVASADHAHAIYLAPFFSRQLRREEPPTLKLLFNMLRANNLPPAQAGDLVELR
jgi:hypothetical protein